ncbi:MAG: outer membrane beta-barrel protein [Acidobacteriota bacterium]
MKLSTPAAVAGPPTAPGVSLTSAVSGPRPWLRVLGCGIAALITLAPVAATAQTDPATPTLTIGPLEFRPKLTLSNIGVDNNVFNSATDPKRDFTLTASPDLEVSMHPGRLFASYAARTDFNYFRTYKSERSVDRSIVARTEVDLGLLKPFVSLTSGHTSSRASSEIDVRARHHPRLYVGGTRIKLATRTAIVLSAYRAIETYDEGLNFRGVDLATSFDSRTTGYESALSLDLTPFTTFTLTAAREQQRFDHTPIRDSDSFRIAPSLTFSPLGLITGNASVGYRRLNGLDPTLPDYGGLVATGGVGMVIAGRYNVSTTFTRDVRYSYEESLPYYLLNAVRGTLAVQFVGPLDLRVTGGREGLSYRALTDGPKFGDDRQILYGGGAGYRLADRLRVVVEALAIRRTSERDAAREYQNNRIVATLNWGAIN